MKKLKCPSGIHTTQMCYRLGLCTRSVLISIKPFYDLEDMLSIIADSVVDADSGKQLWMEGLED